jgi:2-aminomuconate deaminase
MAETDTTSEVTPRGAYPHLRRAGDLVFVSGTSSRRPDNTFAGAAVDEMGTASLDIAAQTLAVLGNMERTLQGVGLDRRDLVDVTSFLVNMNDFGPYNVVWGAFFDGIEAPARTTVAVHQLPHPHLLIEMKATAIVREAAVKRYGDE